MSYKDLFKRLFRILANPKKAWTEITVESPRRDVLATFVYPLIALCGLAVLLSAFMHDGLKREVYQPALMDMLSCCIALFGGFFLASYLSNLIGRNMLGKADNIELNRQLVGYAMVVIFVLEIISGLFTLSILHWILQFYTVFVVYEGARILMQIDEKDLTRFSLIISIIIIVCPAIISTVFNKFI